MIYPKFLYLGGKWSPNAVDHCIVHTEAQEDAAIDAGFAAHDPSLTVKPQPIDGPIDVDIEVAAAGSLKTDNEAPAAPARKPGVARGRRS